VLLFLFGLGFVFFQYGYKKDTVFDKRSDTLLIYSRNLCMHKKRRLFRLSDIKSVRAVERGYEKGQVNTLHYKIVIEFFSKSPLAILETHNSLRVKKEVRENVNELHIVAPDLQIPWHR